MVWGIFTRLFLLTLILSLFRFFFSGLPNPCEVPVIFRSFQVDQLFEFEGERVKEEEEEGSCSSPGDF